MCMMAMLMITRVTSGLNEAVGEYLSIVVEGQVLNLIHSECQGLEKGHRLFTFDFLQHNCELIIWYLMDKAATELD